MKNFKQSGMKNFLCTNLLILMVSLFGFGQISVDVSDMPVAGDTLRVSVANNIPEDFDNTGVDTTWDFSSLQPLNQRLDSFVAATSTPPEFWLFFIPGIETNLASPRSGSFVPGLSVTDAFTFYNKTATAFNDLGYAVKVQGIPFPLRYDEPDTYYKLPLAILSTWSSESAYSLPIPGIGYYGVQRTRTSMVDGWGNLITPFGTFQTLRVKSHVIQKDSIYIDSLQSGIVINRDINEYKWLGKDQGIPLLTITEEGPVVSGLYRDIPRLPVTPFSISLGPDTSVTKGATIDMKATINGGAPPYYVVWNTMDTGKVLTVVVDSTSTFTAVGIDASFNFVSDSKVVTAISPGMEENAINRLTISPNPVDCRLSVELPEFNSSAGLTIMTPVGKILKVIKLDPKSDKRFTVDVTGLHSGIYLIRIVTGSTSYVAKFLKR